MRDGRRSRGGDAARGHQMGTLARYRSFPRPVQLLLLNQLTINIGFSMLIPYLAAHLSVGLGLATWLVGLILGVRNFAQQACS